MDEDMTTAVMRLEMQASLIQMDLRETQKLLFAVIAVIAPAEAGQLKSDFVERRRELLDRILMKWEPVDSGLAAELSELFEDDFQD